MNVKIVVGANYGDEGKGLATNYFSKAADGKVLNALYSSGPQRGHTVSFQNGFSHVFHHFGSGSPSGADTFFDRRFLVNPMVFVKERTDFWFINPFMNVFIDPRCRVTTPYDMFINQIVEIHRGSNKHGSCGYGCWETICRYNGKFDLNFGQLCKLNYVGLHNYLDNIRHLYFHDCLKDYGIDNLMEFDREHSTEYLKLVMDDGILEHYIEDFLFMKDMCKQTLFEDIAPQYDTVVFEGSQGLAINGSKEKVYPYVTVDDIGCKIPFGSLARLNTVPQDIEVCYITRPYFTRHGAGPFETECSKDEINPYMEDVTNTKNPFQDSLRYGKLDCDVFCERIRDDLSSVKDTNVSIFVTQLNYTDNKIIDIHGDISINDFARICHYKIGDNLKQIYISASKFGDDVKTIKV